MAKVKPLTKQQALSERMEDLAEETRNALHQNHISINSVADVAGLNQCSVSNQFRKKRMTLSVYLAAQMLLEEQ